MTSKTITKAASPRTSSTRANRRKSQKKPNRINRQRRLQKQLQILLLERHSRRCIICHHPEREAIEEEFVHWRAPWKLSQDYKLNDYRTVYRHARAAGLLLQRRERLHSALDAFVESVDDVTFTGDTILRAMRAYSCIDSHGRWTEIPTHVQFSTSHDAHPPQPPSPSPRSGSTASGILDVAPKYSNQASRSDATACAASPRPSRGSPAQAFNVPDFDDDRDEDLEEDEEKALEERITALRASSKSMSRSDATACAAPPAQPVSAVALNSNNPGRSLTATACSVSSKIESHNYATACAALPAQPASAVALNSNNPGRSLTATAASASSKTRSHSDATACADSPAQALPRDVVRGQNPNDRPPSDRTDCAASKTRSGSDATACADPPAQALPRDVVRGQNPNDRSPSDRTDCAALPSGGAPAQPAAPQKPKPDADGLIWHPHPGYPNQERSEPDAQGRVFYKIHMTTTAALLRSSETDAQRAAKLIYGSVIKKYGNP